MPVHLEKETGFRIVSPVVLVEISGRDLVTIAKESRNGE
jgi:hypothetical protein